MKMWGFFLPGVLGSTVNIGSVLTKIVEPVGSLFDRLVHDMAILADYF